MDFEKIYCPRLNLFRHVYEKTLAQLGSYESSITSKHHNYRVSSGLHDIILASAKAHLTEDYLELTFLTDSTYGSGIPRVAAHGPKYNYNHEYTMVVRFYKVADTLTPNLKTMPPDERLPLIKKVFDTCDVRFHSDDPSFYWQGGWEQLSRLGLAIYKFDGTKGDGVWKKRHQDAGAGPVFLTKHLCQLLDELEDFLPEIAKVIKVRGKTPAKRKRYMKPETEEPTNSAEDAIEKANDLHDEQEDNKGNASNG